MGHAIDRARERYGVRIQPEDIPYIQSAIRNRNPIAVLVKSRPCGLREFAVFAKGNWVCLLVNQNDYPVTTLPSRHLKPYWDELQECAKAIRRTILSIQAG